MTRLINCRTESEMDALLAEGESLAAKASTPNVRGQISSGDSEQQVIDKALLEAFGKDSEGNGRFSHVQTLPDHVVARGKDGKQYKIPYETKRGGAVGFGEPQEIEQTADESKQKMETRTDSPGDGSQK